MKDYVTILSVGRCSWGKCNFCGWGKLDFGQKSLEELKEQFFKQYNKISKDEEFRLKFYVSGSFFDNQVPEDFFNWLIDFLKKEKENSKNLKAVLFESKIIDLLNKKRVEKFLELNEKGIETWVGIGFEGVSDEELRLLKKDFQSVEQFLRITKLIKEKYNIKFRVYFLINPPIPGKYYLEADELNYWESWTYNNNKEIIEKETKRLRKIIEITKDLFEEVVLINTYPHKNAEVFDLFYNKKWRPLTEFEFKRIFEDVFGEFKNEYILSKTKYEVDFSNYSFVPQFPNSLKKEYKEKLRGAKLENLINRVYEIWEEYILYFYKPKKEKNILFFLPCAAKKPYYLSKTHRLIKRTISGLQIFKKMHWVVVSNPGVIPYEFVDYWPFKSYDWPEWEETEEIKELYYKITKERVKKFLKTHQENYLRIVTFFKPDSLTFKAIEEVIKELKLESKTLHGVDKELYNKIKEKEKKPLFSQDLLIDFREKLKKLQRELNQ